MKSNSIVEVAAHHPQMPFFSNVHRSQMCSYIDAVLHRKQTLYNQTQYIPKYFERCLAPFNDFCGNGFTNFINNEECDPLPLSRNSHCCSNCVMVPGAICATESECCQNCKISDTSYMCTPNYYNTYSEKAVRVVGYCGPKGFCVDALCSQYGNMEYCGRDKENPCLQNCRTNDSECGRIEGYLDSALRQIPYIYPDGTPCGPNSFCQATNDTYSECIDMAEGSKWYESQIYNWSTIAVGSCSNQCGVGTVELQAFCYYEDPIQ
uniref:Disintegrin and metalloproteinase domain-containing protein 15 n=1 Tax=Lygus hesperus TaxID=30085 RepID=A0A0A9WEA9_LYGHE